MARRCHNGISSCARSAIFAPAPRLGLIVIDEEHENSFKQATSPRYHARDVAEWIAQKEKVPLVLGSATPSLDTFARWLGTQAGHLVLGLDAAPQTS